MDVLNMREGAVIPARAVLLTCPENPLIARLGSQILRDKVGLFLNLGAHYTPLIGSLLQQARRAGGAETLLWVRHLQCAALGVDEIRAGGAAAVAGEGLTPLLIRGFERAVTELVGSGAVEGYRVIQAAIWDDASEELHLVQTRELSGDDPQSGTGSSSHLDS